MWLYTNGTQRWTGFGPASGRLSFARRELGDSGSFEARLFKRGTDTVIARVWFEIGR